MIKRYVLPVIISLLFVLSASCEKGTEEAVRVPGEPEVQAEKSTPPPLPHSVAIYRGNSARTGEIKSRGVHILPQPIWKYEANFSIRSLIYYDGKIIFAVGNDLAAVDASTGQELWKFSTGGNVMSVPTVDNYGLAYFGDNEGNFHALEAATGTLKWSFKIEDGINSSPIVHDGYVYFGSSDGNLFSLDARTGVEKWHIDFHANFSAGASIVDGVIYISGGNLRTIAVTEATGKVLWESGASNMNDYPPAFFDGALYVSGYKYLARLNIETGETVWKFDLKGRTSGALAVSGDTVYIGNWSGGMLHAVDAAAGTEKWSYNVPFDNDGHLTIADGVLYFGASDKNLYAIDTATRLLKWNMPVKRVKSSPVINEGIIYYIDDGDLYAAH